jgi:hypothetical protein
MYKVINYELSNIHNHNWMILLSHGRVKNFKIKGRITFTLKIFLRSTLNFFNKKQQREIKKRYVYQTLKTLKQLIFF